MSEPALSAAEPRRRAPAPLRGVRAAFVFLTRLRVGGFPYSDSDWSWASAHFPLVGAVLGLGLGLLYRALLPLGALGAAVLTLAASMLATGALHEDGLADTFDALGGATGRERIVEILKDSRVGSFGAAALAASLLARAALLARLGGDAVWLLPLALCAARTAPVWLLRALPYVSQAGVARSRLVARAGVAQVVVATGWLAGVTALALHSGTLGVPRAAALVASAAVVALVTGSWYARRLGGLTGDFLGATEQIAEVAALAVLVWGR